MSFNAALVLLLQNFRVNKNSIIFKIIDVYHIKNHIYTKSNLDLKFALSKFYLIKQFSIKITCINLDFKADSNLESLANTQHRDE